MIRREEIIMPLAFVLINAEIGSEDEVKKSLGQNREPQGSLHLAS